MNPDKTPERTPEEPTETLHTGKGMPKREARPAAYRDGKAITPQDASDEASLRLPHERDQSTDMTPDRSGPRIEQAQKDVESGRQDTSKSIEMNSAYQKQK